MKPMEDDQLARWLDAVTALRLFIVLLVTAFLFALALCGLSTSHNGIERSGTQGGNVTFLDCLLFSVATISTLGSGDYSAVGASRLLVLIEGGVGLVAIAVIISKLASSRQSSQLRLLVNFEQQRRMREFTDRLDDLAIELERVTSVPADYGEIPGTAKELKRLTASLFRFARFQNGAFDLFRDQPEVQVRGLLRSLYRVVGLRGGIAQIAREHPDVRPIIAAILKNVAEIAELGDSKVDRKLAEAFLRLREFVTRQQDLINLRPPEWTEAILKEVAALLPSPPWSGEDLPEDIHVQVAAELGLAKHVVWKAIEELRKRGVSMP